MPRKVEPSQSGPLERYVCILELLAAHPGGLSAADMEKILDLPKTTVNRLLHALQASDLVTGRGARNATFVMGDRLNKVLRAETAWIQLATQRRLKKLADEVGESCFISRRLGDIVESVAMESPDASVGIYITPGHALPWYATASGKLLSALADTPIEPTRIERFTGNTIVDEAKLAEEFAQIREQGYALERSEHVPGLATIAVAINTGQGPDLLYGVGMTGPEGRIVDNLPTNVTILRKAASQFSAILAPHGA